MTRFFTADTHFGHDNIIAYDCRPLPTADEMDELLIKNWNAVVGKADHVYHCGDFAWRGSKFAGEIKQRLNGQVHLILGNHDKISKEVAKMFASVSQLKTIRIEGQKIWLSHFPLKTWVDKNGGAWNIHGHCHGRLTNPEPNAVDIGVLSWDWTPVTFQEIQRHLIGRKYAWAEQQRKKYDFQRA